MAKWILILLAVAAVAVLLMRMSGRGS